MLMLETWSIVIQNTKMVHTLRCSPCTNHARFKMFDNLLRKGIGAICNLDLTDLQWLQASLPVEDGGQSVRRVSSLTSSAFLASAQQPMQSFISQLDRCPGVQFGGEESSIPVLSSAALGLRGWKTSSVGLV